jgi:hypothetical protein|tara:strand:- start:11 stop:190 length:180 start_codon:yes stop_codon:yes gene_type:complete
MLGVVEVAQKDLFLLEEQEEVHLLVVEQDQQVAQAIMQLLIQVVVQELGKMELEQAVQV